MPEEQNDDFYWEPDPAAPLRQGDLLLNVPVTVLSDEPEFVLRAPSSDQAEIKGYARFPDHAPTEEFITLGDWGALSMIVTPTCHVSEEEKNEEIVAIVPVQPVYTVVEAAAVEQLRSGQDNIHHLFYLPSTTLGDDVLAFDAVALLDRPACFPKRQLRDYRRLGLFRDRRYELRKKLAWFWARGSASDSLDRDLKAKIENDVPLDRIE